MTKIKQRIEFLEDQKYALEVKTGALLTKIKWGVVSESALSLYYAQISRLTGYLASLTAELSHLKKEEEIK